MTLISKFVLDLIAAEEAYLRACGWVKVKGENTPGANSVWRTGEFTEPHARNYAVLICKASDPNIGIQ